MITPGTYLRLRREAAGLTLREVAALVGAVRFNLLAMRMTSSDIDLLADRYAKSEADRDGLTPAGMDALKVVYAFSRDVYEQLQHLHDCAAIGGDPAGLPVPQICRLCGCSWNDPCLTDFTPCAWSADPELCTACAARAVRTIDGETTTQPGSTDDV